MVNRRKIEQLTSSLAVFLLFFLSVGLMIFFGDEFFSWNIFPPGIEKVLGFVMASSAVLIFSSVLVNVMINLSLIAKNSDRLLHEHFKLKAPEDVSVSKLSNPIILVGIIAVVGTGIVLSLAKVNTQRSEQVTQRYVEESNRWIEANREGLTVIFTELFPNEICYKNEDISCPPPEAARIAEAVNNQLTDFSSTMFVKKGVGNQVLLMYLSGEVAEFHSFQPENKIKLEELLNGNHDYLAWDEYVQFLPGKEVVVAVRSADGELLGGLVRGVIE